MPSRGSFLKWSLILKHLQNQHPLNDFHEALRVYPETLFCLFHEYFCHFEQIYRLVIQLKACLPVISSGARRAESRNLHIVPGRAGNSHRPVLPVRSLRALRLVEMTKGAALGRDDNVEMLGQDDRRAWLG